ncbi:hypothetical protein BD410DRAFT_837726 [Rickenella mellea]|uniref:PPP4R2-domain-containing protein n=1 Tax=Rickenella mellea TaxID=50990 RepID=A0A4Y7QC51_9AGAM|nr:hypothetical protein BD410DRAFT_837726 [Rickenella mellea]
MTSIDAFERADYEALLEQIAVTDHVETEWPKLRDIIKYKIQQNIADYLRDSNTTQTDQVQETNTAHQHQHHLSTSSTSTSAEDQNPTLSPHALTNGGLRLPPFPRREVNEFVRNTYNSHGRQKSDMSEDEARVMKESIFAQLHDFEEHRVCELALHPRVQYKSVGKYLRAVEKTFLVTSTHDAFPIGSGGGVEDSSDIPSSLASSTTTLQEATTPLFSPIPFLHDDARRSRSRSRSRSPPLSPLDLAARHPSGPGTPQQQHSAITMNVDAAGVLGVSEEGLGEGPVIGLVDELDDPRPGHMSDHPTALTSTTSTSVDEAVKLRGSLEDRFVKASGDSESDINGSTSQEGKLKEEEDHEVEDMVLDETDDDKENKA